MSRDNSLNSSKFEVLRKKAIKFLSSSEGNLHPLGVADAKTLIEVLEELRIYQAELEIQNEELQDTLKLLETSKAHYLKLFHDNPLPLVVIDDKGVIHELNKSGMTLLKLHYPTNRKSSIFKFVSQTSAIEIVNALKALPNSHNLLSFRVFLTKPEPGLFECIFTRYEHNPTAPYLLIFRDITHEMRLIEEQQLLREVINNDSEVFILLDCEFNLILKNDLATDFLDVSTEEKLPINVLNILPTPLVEKLNAIKQAGLNKEQSFIFHYSEEINGPKNDSFNKHFYCKVFQLFSALKQTTLFGVTFADQTEEFHSQLQLDISKEVFSNSLQGIVILSNDYKVVYVNEAFEKITGFSPSEVTGELLSSVDFDFVNSCKYPIAKALEKGSSWLGEIVTQHKSGEELILSLSINRINHEKNNQRFILLLNDLTSQKNAEEQIRSLAYYDSLTGVANRNQLLQSLELKIRDLNESICIMFVDLDFFKNVNDTHGHDTGDLLLKKVALRLVNIKRTNDEVYRIGGDEFVILFHKLNREKAIHKAKQINATLERPFEINNHQLLISCSIGMSFFPDDSKDSESLLKQADIAMYHAKKSGRNGFSFFNQSLAYSIERIVRIEQSLKKAVLDEQLTFALQPIFDCNNNQIISHELLLRWPNSGIEDLSAEEFIMIAEDNGSLINSICHSALAKAFDIINNNLSADLQFRVGINMSEQDFINSAHFSSFLNLCKKNRDASQFLDVEITERLMLKEPDKRCAQLTELRDLGVQILVDDFGTGYSSLSYLMQFPIDALKIDKSFVTQMLDDVKAQAVVRSIISLAKNLGLIVIAEGVESELHLKALKMLGCDRAQGFYFSPKETF